MCLHAASPPPKPPKNINKKLVDHTSSAARDTENALPVTLGGKVLNDTQTTACFQCEAGRGLLSWSGGARVRVTDLLINCT